ncbi:oxidoreductase, partial [Streptomyces sp. SID5926]|nr:oxidoreductase [Streptomyces sp. SID5926]
MPGRIEVNGRVAGTWQTATLTGIRRETPRAST